MAMLLTHTMYEYCNLNFRMAEVHNYIVIASWHVISIIIIRMCVMSEYIICMYNNTYINTSFQVL